MHLLPTRSLITGTAMFSSGWLALGFAVDPGYASPLWPPAGIALAAVLLWGRSMLPAIWLGSFALNLWIGHHAAAGMNLIAAGAAFGIAFGSSLQALLAGWLLQRQFGSGVPALDNPRGILQFILLAGPLSCVTAASAGVATLTLSGVIPAGNAAFSWWNWWIGDSLGVVIITPVILTLAAPAGTLWRSRQLSVSLPLLGVLIALVTTFFFVSRAEQARLQLAFDNQAAAMEKALLQHTANIMDGAAAVRDLFTAAQNVSRSDFALFSQSMIRRHPEIQALEWLPRITATGRDSFEAAVRKEGHAGFTIMELAPGGNLKPAELRDEYYPILYVEPMRGNERAFGLDSTSNPLSRASKQRAIDTGEASVSGRIRLAQRDDDEAGILVSIPVLQPGSGEALGFVSAVLLPSHMAAIALRELDLSNFNIRLQDLSAPPAESELFTRISPRPAADGNGPQPLVRTFDFGDRQWELTISADRGFLELHGSSLPWITLLGGLILTALLGAYLLTVTGRAASIEILVKARTEALELSERTLRNAQEVARVGSWTIDMEQNRLHWSEMTHRIFGIPQGVELSYETFLDRVHPDDRRAVNTAWTLAVERRTDYNIEHRIQVNGQTRWVHERAQILFDRDGRPVSAIGTVHDLTDRKLSELGLMESELKLRTIVESQPECVNLLGRQGELLQINRAGLAMIEADAPEQVLGRNFSELLLPAWREPFRELSQHVFYGKSGTMQFEITGLKGTRRLLETHAVPMRDAHGDITALLGITRDITAQKQSEEKLVLASRVFSEAHEGILITDARGRILDINPTFSEITGYSRDEVLGKTPGLLKSGKHPEEFYASLWKDLLRLGHWQGEVWNRKKNGELYAELLTISALRDDRGNILHFVGLFSDITQSKHQQQALEQMAHFDVLTRLPNRVLFADRFQQAIARARRDGSQLAICYLDLDGFKQVNDTLGHDAGDQLLIEVAERIKSALREEDTVSRIGGDEFALLLGGLTSLEQFEQALQRIHASIAQAYLIDGESVHVGASSGVTIYPLDDADPDTLLRHADQAMYQAKLAGRNRYQLFDASRDQQMQNRQSELELLEQALARGEFCLYYQPKVDMQTGKVAGAEALIRWNDPGHGLRAPAEFLPVLEGTPLEITLSNWVIEQALQQLEAWREVGLELQVSVNISSNHLHSPDFFAEIDSALGRHPSIRSDLLQLEVLESCVLGDVNTVSEVIRTCRSALGVSVALDDFGTGYSSLTHLRHLSVNTIKIDQSFVRDMIDDPDDFTIVEGVIGLAQAFRREIVAEGVETREHGLMLMALGCALAQGYGIARPMPASQLPAWVKEFRPDAKWQDFACNPPDARQRQILLLVIESHQWLERIVQCLHTEPGKQVHWPIMLHENCHCGRWIAQSRREMQVDSALLAALETAHGQLHEIGSQLMHQYQTGETEQARAGIERLRSAFTRVEMLIDQLS